MRDTQDDFDARHERIREDHARQRASAEDRRRVDAESGDQPELAGTWTEQRERDRALLASLELLVALKGVVSAWEDQAGLGTMSSMSRAIVDARAAIAKAEGE